MRRVLKRLGILMAGFTVIFTLAGASPASAAGTTGEARQAKHPIGTMTIAEIAVGNGNFKTLVSLLQLTGLDQTVASNDVRLTVFAPTDDAFTKLFTANPDLPGVLTSDAEKANNYPLLKNVLLYHVTEGRRFSDKVFGRRDKAIEMLNMGEITTHPNLTITDESGQTISPVAGLTDISASNGVVHVIDTVMLPAAGQHKKQGHGDHHKSCDISDASRYSTDS